MTGQRGDRYCCWDNRNRAGISFRDVRSPEAPKIRIVVSLAEVIENTFKSVESNCGPQTGVVWHNGATRKGVWWLPRDSQEASDLPAALLPAAAFRMSRSTSGQRSFATVNNAGQSVEPRHSLPPTQQPAAEFRAKISRFRPDGGKTAGSSLMDFAGAGKPPFSTSILCRKNRFFLILCQF